MAYETITKQKLKTSYAKEHVKTNKKTAKQKQKAKTKKTANTTNTTNAERRSSLNADTTAKAAGGTTQQS